MSLRKPAKAICKALLIAEVLYSSIAFWDVSSDMLVGRTKMIVSDLTAIDGKNSPVRKEWTYKQLSYKMESMT